MRKTGLRDIPKGKRLEHFLIYYGKSVLLWLFCGGLVLYTVYLAIGKPSADFSILILSDSFDLSCETALRERFADQPGLDRNQDGTVRVLLNYFQTDPVSGELPVDDRMALMTILSAGDTDFFLADRSAASWLRENDLIADWDDSGSSGFPVEDMKLFRDRAFDSIRNLTLYVASPKERTQQWQEETAALLQALQ